MSDDEPFLWRGMDYYEHEAVARATKIALRETRLFWLSLLEEWLAKTDNPIEQAIAEAEIRRLHRRLGIKPQTDDEIRRAATRERVRQHRERKRQGIVLRPRREPAPPDTAETSAEDVTTGRGFGTGSRGSRSRRKAEPTLIRNPATSCEKVLVRSYRI